MIMRQHILALSVAIPALAAAAAAPAPTTADPAQIVVQGTRDREKQIREFVREMTPAPIRGQLARFEIPICPVALGIEEQQARQVESRIRDVAKAVGLAVEKAGCQANLALFVTPNKAALLTELERWPFMFPDEWSQGDIDALKRDPSPVAAWHTEHAVWLDGIPLNAADSSANVPDPASGSHLRFPHGVATRLRPSARPMFRKSVVIVQADALAGLTPIQVADYAVMRSLIRSDPKELKAAGSKTILNILDTPMGSPAPVTMTAWDVAFLKSFYGSTKNMYVEYQRAQMKGEMKRELDRLATDEGK